MPQYSPQYQPEPTYLQQPPQQQMQMPQSPQQQMQMPMPPPQQPQRRTAPPPTSLPMPAPLPAPPPQHPSPGPYGAMPPQMPAGPTPTTHYGKLSVLMLLLGGVLGYAYKSAVTGPAACAAYATNSSRAVVLTGVLNALDVSNSDALANQIDTWVSYQSSGGTVAATTSGGDTSITTWLATPTPGASRCADGLFLAGPQPSPLNIVIYLMLLLWSFMGVAIGADVFMAAIEMITSQETTIYKVVNGQTKPFTVLVWNSTIANLTLMALGSSAPEILLSVIEITTSGFYAGELGPSTIVGSAAFNLLVISAVCVTAIPNGEGRLIQDRSVFTVTATFSVLAYVWLIVILMWISPNVVEVWEGCVTFFLFGLLVWMAFAADQGACNCGGDSAESGGKVIAVTKSGKPFDMDAALSAFDSGLSPEEQQAKLADMMGKPKTRAYYRVNAVHSMTGAHTIDEKKAMASTGPAVFNFATAMLTPKAGMPFVDVVVTRSGNMSIPAAVAYRSVGAATESKGEGFITVAAFQSEASVRLPILPGEAAFYVVLVDPVQGSDIGSTWSCAVLVEKPSSAGMLKFEHEKLSVKESQGKIDVTVLRVGGTAGRIKCKVQTKDQTALAGSDYEPIDQMIILKDGETRSTFTIYIVDDDVYESDETFQVILSEPEGGVTFDPTCDGGADKAVATVTIVSDEQVRRKVDELAALVHFNHDDIALSANTWGEQFAEALEYDGEGLLGGVVYLLTLPWKFAFAFTPPARMLGGWLCFGITLVFIGLLTALIGDLAAHMGCCMGIAPAITAITFVALGTSLPDTFASKTAAQSEPYADSSIGNITGSNSVNVFLGLGMPWMIAALYWSYSGQYSQEAAWRARYSSYDWYSPDMAVAFVVDAGDLGFSVMVFTACALLCLGTLVLRRATVGYELGGSQAVAGITAIFFVFLWFVYIGMSVLYTYRIGPFEGA